MLLYILNIIINKFMTNIIPSCQIKIYNIMWLNSYNYYQLTTVLISLVVEIYFNQNISVTKLYSILKFRIYKNK